MKWWGWGEEGIAFRHDDKPAFAAFIKNSIDIDVTKPPAAVADLDSLPIHSSLAPPALRASLRAIVGPDNSKDDPLHRLVHAYGKGLRDLVRIRHADTGRLPDLVVYPGSEDEVVRIVEVALNTNAVVIPFGGGTNISGSLEAPCNESRPSSHWIWAE
jgi:alkyldihydroxyacetonephosphate synthase